MLTLNEFKASLKGATPNTILNVQLKSLWYDAKGDWDQAHGQIDRLGDPDSAWVHGYLHRKEGDLANADYWYRKAGKLRAEISLDEEWAQLVKHFLHG